MVDANRFAETFQLIDANQDGLISAAEFERLMAALDDPIDSAAAERAVQLMDTNGDGLISLDEFARYFGDRAGPASGPGPTAPGRAGPAGSGG